MQSETTIAAVTDDGINIPTVPNVNLPSTTPSGPVPGSPRNISIEKMAQGWVVSWLPPFEPKTQVAYYQVQHRIGEGDWATSESISKDTAYLSKWILLHFIPYHEKLILFPLVKELKPSIKHTFRVWAYSIMGLGEASEPIEYKLPSKNI